MSDNEVKPKSNRPEAINNQHLYLVSDEEIKEGDWYYTSLEHDRPWICKCKSIDKSKEYWLDGHLKYVGGAQGKWGSYKIIATTDKSLGLPLIPESFVKEWTEKQGKIEYVHLSYCEESKNFWFKNLLAPEVIILPTKDSFSRDEVKDIDKAHKRYIIDSLKDKGKIMLSFDEWFDKNY